MLGALAVVSVAAASGRRLVVEIRGGATTLPSTTCFLLLRSPVAGGGTETYCLRSFHGEPGPGATVRDSGTLAFRLPAGTITARVSIVQRFDADGTRARQTLDGTLVGGTGRYRGIRGTISGGGTDVESPPGTVVSASLRYVLRF